MSTQNVVCFFGADSKVGVSMISQSFAETAAFKFRNKKVLLLNLSGYPGSIYSGMNFPYCFDDIRIHLQSNVLTVDELINVCAKKDNLYILKGTKQLKERRRFGPELVEKLIDAAREFFDLVVINGGYQVDNGMSLGAVLYSDIRMLVTTQQYGTYLSYQMMEDVIYELLIKFDLLLINKFLYDISRFYSPESEMKKLYGISETVIVPMSEYGWQAEKEAATLLDFGEKDYKQSILSLVQEVLCRTGDPDYQGEPGRCSKNSILNIFGRRVKR